MDFWTCTRNISYVSVWCRRRERIFVKTNTHEPPVWISSEWSRNDCFENHWLVSKAVKMLYILKWHFLASHGWISLASTCTLVLINMYPKNSGLKIRHVSANSTISCAFESFCLWQTIVDRDHHRISVSSMLLAPYWYYGVWLSQFLVYIGQRYEKPPGQVFSPSQGSQIFTLTHLMVKNCLVRFELGTLWG